jgi:hypothetical protein
MSLSPSQSTALKADIGVNANTIPAGFTWTGAFAGLAVKDVPATGDGNIAVAGWYSLTASPAYAVWNTQTPLKAIRAATDLSKYTPADAVPASAGSTQNTNDQLVYQNRALACQLKQANAVFLIQGEGTVDATGLQFRQSFNDCMTLVPSGTAGANQNAGWGTPAAPGAVRLAMQRSATNAEKLFAVQSTAAPNAGNVGVDARGSATNPDALVYVGGITFTDVESARTA